MSILVSNISQAMLPEQEALSALSLESLMTKAVAEASEDKYAAKVSELERVQDYRNTSSPEDLYAFQTRASEYNLTVSLYSALTRKAVTAIDTVIRA